LPLFVYRTYLQQRYNRLNSNQKKRA